MAELGAIASIVQLVDVALRVSGEVRNFLDAYRDTERDVRSLRDSMYEGFFGIAGLCSYL